jgi:hypothetical protein
MALRIDAHLLVRALAPVVGPSHDEAAAAGSTASACLPGPEAAHGSEECRMHLQAATCPAALQRKSCERQAALQQSML